MQNIKKAVVTLTAISGMCLAGATGVPADQHSTKPQTSTTKHLVRAKARRAKIMVDPANVSIDHNGNVLIKDPELARQIRGSMANKGVDMDGWCCSGCGCS